MERKKDSFVSIGETLSGLDGPVKAIREASPPARHHFSCCSESLARTLLSAVGKCDVSPFLYLSRPSAHIWSRISGSSVLIRSGRARGPSTRTGFEYISSVRYVFGCRR